MHISITRSSYYSHDSSKSHDHRINHTIIASITWWSHQSHGHRIDHAIIISITRFHHINLTTIISVARSSYQSRDQHITHIIIISITRCTYQRATSITRSSYQSHDNHINHTIIISITRSSYWSHDHHFHHTIIISVTRPSYQSHDQHVNHTIIIPVTRSSYQSRGGRHYSITRSSYQVHDNHINHTTTMHTMGWGLVTVTSLRPSRDLQHTQQHMSSGTGQHTSHLALKIINRSGHDNLQQQSKYTNQGVSTCIKRVVGTSANARVSWPAVGASLVILCVSQSFMQLILFVN